MAVERPAPDEAPLALTLAALNTAHRAVLVWVAVIRRAVTILVLCPVFPDAPGPGGCPACSHQPSGCPQPLNAPYASLEGPVS